MKGKNMQQTYKDFISEIKDKTIMFCGLGKSNIPFLEMLAKQKINIVAYDGKTPEKIDSSLLKILKSYESIKLYLGDESAWNLTPDILIRTPGISFCSEKISNMRERGVTVTSEMEIFFELCPCKIIGITGSDGKTTVTTIISEILKQSGIKIHVGGNIGNPLLPKIEKINKNDIAVIELSSFQLLSMRKSPEIAVITNISPNHLDVHRNMDEYILAKKQIFLHQNAFSRTVINFDDKISASFTPDIRGETIYFSTETSLKNGVWINKHGDIINSSNGTDDIIMHIEDIKIPGKHNLKNYLAAIACLKNIVLKDSIVKIAKTFAGVEHRIEFVREINGIKFYNDSIASTPVRVISGALSLFEKNITLIAGGYNKNLSFTEFAEKVAKRVSVLILFGNSSEKIEKEILVSQYYDPSKLKI
ncbi:MAG: UDP-N-acetylmuramoyl-L-alanine--D-glutamate ligase, partial [Acutalibacteraceae bacterium]